MKLKLVTLWGRLDQTAQLDPLMNLCRKITARSVFQILNCFSFTVIDKKATIFF